MQLRRFTSDSTSKALQAVREAFGDDAVILSNRQVDGRVEIIATGTFDENAVMATAVAGEITTAATGPAVSAEPDEAESGSDPAPEDATEAAFAAAPATVSPFVPDTVPAAAAVNAPRYDAPDDDEVTVSLSDTARAAATASNAEDSPSSEEGPSREELPRTAPAFSSVAGASDRAAADPGAGADGQARAEESAAGTANAIDSLSRDLEAMSGDERPLTLGPVPDVESLDVERRAGEDRAGFASGPSWKSTSAGAANPSKAVPVTSGADAEVPGGASTVAAIGQVLAVAERRHAERARRLEQRFLRLEVNLWGELEPLRSAHLRQLVRLGVGMELAVRLVERITPGMEADTAMRQSLALLKATLPIGVDGSGRAPGVTVLSGPAGSGKTTTLVKLATRQVRLHGAQSTVLVAADARRIGAFESLQAYGRLLGVPVVQARTADELAERIASFAHKPLMLIDHVPLELADTLPLPHASALGDCDDVPRELRRLLVLPATLEPSAFEAQVAAHRRHGITHAVLTQLDRATRLASCFAPLIRHALPMAYVSDDARVLTPLGNADAATLVATAMTRGQEKASGRDEELLLNLLQPTRRVIESVAGETAEQSAERSGTTRSDTANRPSADIGERVAESTSARTSSGEGRAAETSADPVAGTSAITRVSPSDEAARGGAPARRGTLERIVAFEAVDRHSVIDDGGGIDAIETREVIETLGDVPPSLLDELSSEFESKGRRSRAERRARRNANDRTNRQETRR